MVDGLSARLVHPHVQTRRSSSVQDHDRHLPRSWRQGHSRSVKRREREQTNLSLLTRLCVSRYDMEPYDVGRIWGWRRGKQFVEPLMVMLFPHSCLLRSRPGFTYYDYPGIYNDSNFHHCGLEPDDNIVDYNNEVEVWTCQLEGLAECVRVFAFSRSFGRYLFFFVLTPIRAPVWQQIPNSFAWYLQGTPIISSPWESMDCVWTRRRVGPPLKLF